jgi:hypothetical protein
MKLAELSTAAARQERADRLRRDRAAALALRTAFPAVQQLHLELKFQGTSENTPAAQSHILHPPARAYFTYPCPYADCNGQFDLAEAVRAAMVGPPYRAEGVLECSGVRARDHSSKQPCLLRLVYTVAATCEGAQ